MLQEIVKKLSKREKNAKILLISDFFLTFLGIIFLLTYNQHKNIPNFNGIIIGFVIIMALYLIAILLFMLFNRFEIMKAERG